MIIPFLQQQTSYASCTPNVYLKQYISYHEEYKNLKFARYLTQDGWKKACPFYFDSAEDAMKVFNEFNQNRLLVDENEYHDEIEYREDYLNRYYEDTLNDLDELMEEYERGD